MYGSVFVTGSVDTMERVLSSCLVVYGLGFGARDGQKGGRLQRQTVAAAATERDSLRPLLQPVPRWSWCSPLTRNRSNTHNAIPFPAHQPWHKKHTHAHTMNFGKPLLFLVPSSCQQQQTHGTREGRKARSMKKKTSSENRPHRENKDQRAS